MSPEEMEEWAALMDNERLEKERQPGCCAKLSHFFCKQKHTSHLETYLELKKSEGREGDYSVIDNESILKKYGIVIPDDLPEVPSLAEGAS